MYFFELLIHARMPKSLIFNFLPIYFLLSYSVLDFNGADKINPCEEISVTLLTTPATPGHKDGKVKASVGGGTTPIYYIFQEPNGRPLSYKVEVDSLYNLGAGRYICTIYNGSGCTKSVEFIIE